MLKKSFFNRQKPAVTLLCVPNSISEALATARTAEFQGADAVAIQMENIPLEERTKDNFAMLMNEVHLPFMFILYRSCKVHGNNDEARQQHLLDAVDAGAEVVDVMGDLFGPAEYELATDPVAIEKQKELIRKIHDKGGKVIMSSHMLSKARTAEEVLAHLQAQAERGADILKIVTACNTEAEFLEAVRTTMLLNREIKQPFVHLCGGKWSRLHRYMSPILGSSISFAVPGYQAPNLGYFSQPTITAFRAVLGNIPFHIDDVQ
ncbi:MAG: type I 3-dehydroquinate dehydratase [Lentisphaeria bacterium]|nr:type I 3-dehydroquinate dehydratase [Lentisphaeria bacterium]